MRRSAHRIFLTLAATVFIHHLSAEAEPAVTLWEQAVGAAQHAADEGEFDLAEQLLMVEVANLETTPDRTRLMVTLNELAVVYYSMGQYSKSERTYHRAIQFAEGPPRAGGLAYAKLLDGLASVYLSVGRYSEAERLRVRALEQLPPDIGPDHSERGQILSNLGTLYASRKKYEQALRAYQQALQIFENGSDDDHACRVVQNLGVLAAQMGDYMQATEYLTRAVSGLEGRLGSSHPVLVRPLINQADVYLRLKMPTAAEAFALRAVTIAQSAFAPMHPMVAAAMMSYSETLKASNRKTEAKEMRSRALRILRENRADHAAATTTVHVSDLSTRLPR